MFRTGTIPTKDGLKLFFRLRRSDEPLGTVVLVHGFAEHSGRYGHVLDALYESQFNVLAVDLRGHGYSEGRRGFINSLDDYIADLDSTVEFAKKTFGETQVFLQAHSMGALVSTLYAVQFPNKLKGLVLSAPLFGIKMGVPFWKRGLGHLMSKYWPSFAMPNEIDASQLSHDKKKCEGYANDPIIFHHVTARWFAEVVEHTDAILDYAPRLAVPFLMQLAGADRLVDSAKCQLWFSQCKESDRTLKTYDGFFHEIYNELERDTPISEFLGWLKERCSRTHKKNDKPAADAVGDEVTV